MDLMQAIYDSGDIKWLIPALVGALIVVIGLFRLLFVERVGWALALVIVFGGALSAVSAVEDIPFRTVGGSGSASGNAGGIDPETVAAVGEAGEKLNAAVSANTRAIEGVQSAIGEIRAFTEVLAVASREQGGPVALTDAEIDRYKSGMDVHLTQTSAAIGRSKEAELEAVRTLGNLDQAIREKLQAPTQ